MNTAIATHDDLGTLRVVEVVALLGLPSKHTAKQQLSGLVDDAVKSIIGIVHRLVLSTIEKRTGDEFRAAFAETFPNYARLMIAISTVITSTVSRSLIDRISSESFCEMESDIREHALPAFGADVQSQAMFTVWTMRKINDLMQQIAQRSDITDSLKERDGRIAAHFTATLLTARFGLDCLTLSMYSPRNHPIYPEVLEVITDLLRSAVNAYAWIRQGVDLRFPVDEPVLPNVEWDDEDQELLNGSMRDMETEIV
jgi:hypothetical protein